METEVIITDKDQCRPRIRIVVLCFLEVVSTVLIMILAAALIFSLLSFLK